MTWIFIAAPIILFFILFLGPARLCVRWASAPDKPKIAVRFNLWKNVLGFIWMRENGVNCFIGLVFAWPLLRIRRPVCKIKEHPAPAEKKIEKKSRKQQFCFIGRLTGMAPTILRRLFRCLNIVRFRLHGNIGLDNPAHTGLAYGIVQSLRPFQNEKVNIEFMPVFQQNTLDCQADIMLRVIMAQLLFVAIRTGIRVGWLYRRCRH